jgi:nitroreductase
VLGAGPTLQLELAGCDWLGFQPHRVTEETIVEIDPAAVDAIDVALTTTRAVRKRLDLEREVSEELILDCIDIAEQAPTGGNLGSRRWLVVRDPKRKQQLAEVYMESAGAWMLKARDALAGSGTEQERMMSSAAHLAEHLAEVPAIVIPTIIGRHDGSGRPGLFDSVIQAAWSFCVAMRARGLGTAWVTAVFADESKVKELFGIPDDMTEIVMLPVAWTKGTDFKRAPRHPAREITYFDGFARTYERGPSAPIRMADGPGTIAEIDIDAPPAVVWELVSDIELPAQFSEEFLGASWDGDGVPSLGASFTGRNRHAAVGEWEVQSYILDYEPDRCFGWGSVDPNNPGARWRFDLEKMPGGTRLRFVATLGPGVSGTPAAIDAMPDKEDRILNGRLREVRANMERTVQGIKELAESRAAEARPRSGSGPASASGSVSGS